MAGFFDATIRLFYVNVKKPARAFVEVLMSILGQPANPDDAPLHAPQSYGIVLLLIRNLAKWLGRAAWGSSLFYATERLFYVNVKKTDPSFPMQY